MDSSPPELMASTLSPLTVQPNAAATPPNGSPAPQAAQLIHSNQPTTPTSNISSIASVPNHPLEQQELQPVQSAPVMVDSPVAATSAELAAEPVGKATTAVQPPHPTMQNSAPGRTVNTLVSEPSGQLSSALQGLQSYPPVQPQQSAAAVPQHLPQGLAAVPALMQQSGHDPDKASHAVHSGHSRLHPTVASELRSPGLAAVPEVVQQLAENQVPHAVQPRQPASVVSEHLPKGLAAVPAMVAEDQNQMPHAVHAEQISFQTMPATEALVQQAVSLGEADAADFSIVDAALGREEVTTSAGNVHTNIRVLDEDDEEVGAMDESDDEAGANVFEGITVLDGDDNEVGAMEDYDDEADSDLFEDEVPILGGRRTFASSAQ